MADRTGPRLLAGFLIAGGIVAAATVPVPYVVLGPGPVYDTLGSTDGTPLVSISGAPTYPTTGKLNLTTVSESGGPNSQMTVLGALSGWVDPSEVVVPERLLYPDNTSGAQIQQENAAEMTQSQDAAAVAALRQLELPVQETVTVASVSTGAPADGKLKVGDRILSVNGVAVATPEALRAEIAKGKPGDVDQLRIVRDGTTSEVAITTVASPTDATKPLIGIIPGVGYTSPVTVTIQLNDVGGPSAGLMFSLGIVDKLTPQQETGGKNIAGTGTIDSNGVVGPIGGIEQKMRGARNEGATVFLVPADNCAEAKPAAPAGLRLVKVTSLSQALGALNTLVSGQGSVPTC